MQLYLWFDKIEEFARYVMLHLKHLYSYGVSYLYQLVFQQ